MPSKYPKLNDEDWLQEQYVNQGCTSPEIASDVGCSASTVVRALKRADIEVASPASGQRLGRNLTSREEEIIEGELLGDGALRNHTDQSPNAVFQYATSRRDYRDWLADFFENVGFEVSRRDYEFDDGRKRYNFDTKSYRCLGSLYEKWYPGGNRTVPGDVTVTPLSLRQWYIGDGTFSTTNQTLLSTNCFSDDGRRLLIRELAENGIEANQQGRGELLIRRKSHDRFFEYMAPLPSSLETVYGYKWP